VKKGAYWEKEKKKRGGETNFPDNPRSSLVAQVLGDIDESSGESGGKKGKKYI